MYSNICGLKVGSSILGTTLLNASKLMLMMWKSGGSDITAVAAQDRKA